MLKRVPYITEVWLSFYSAVNCAPFFFLFCLQRFRPLVTCNNVSTGLINICICSSSEERRPYNCDQLI